MKKCFKNQFFWLKLWWNKYEKYKTSVNLELSSTWRLPVRFQSSLVNLSHVIAFSCCISSWMFYSISAKPTFLSSPAFPSVSDSDNENFYLCSKVGLPTILVAWQLERVPSPETEVQYTFFLIAIPHDSLSFHFLHPLLHIWPLYLSFQGQYL